MLITLSRLIITCLPNWMKRYFDYDPDADPLDLSTASTRPGRRSSMFDPRFSDFNPIQPPVPQWQAEADDSLNLSRHSTLPGRRSSVYEPYEPLPDLLQPARRRSSVLEPVGEAEAAPVGRRSSVPIVPDPGAVQQDDGGRNDQARRHGDWQQQAGFTREDRNQYIRPRQPIETRQSEPDHTDGQKQEHHPNEVRRSWPDTPEKGERRIVSANYSAVEIHGFFGLIDDGSDGAGRMLIVHVPKWIRGYFLDIKQGDTLHVYHAKGKKVGGGLTVLSTGRHKYYAPGRRVTTCTVCVPEEQWAPFV
jgi:hypothetical protein